MRLAVLLLALLSSGCTVDVCTSSLFGPSGLVSGPAGTTPKCTRTRIP